MGTTDDIKTLRGQGKSDQEVIQDLQDRGVSDDEISNALSQSRIKEAVSAPSPGSEDLVPSMMTTGQTSASSVGEQLTEKQEQPPVMGQTYAPQQQQGYYDPQQQYPQDQYQQQYADQGYNQYPVYQPSGLSPDTITEIAEQVISEKMEETRDKIQQFSNFRLDIATAVENIDERLKRIEKIIDRLQLSVLQKVGDYVNNVDDIKKELIETQKSFKALLPQAKRQRLQEE